MPGPSAPIKPKSVAPASPTDPAGSTQRGIKVGAVPSPRPTTIDSNGVPIPVGLTPVEVPAPVEHSPVENSPTSAKVGPGGTGLTPVKPPAPSTVG